MMFVIRKTYTITLKLAKRSKNVNAVCILQDSEKSRGRIFESVKFEKKIIQIKSAFLIILWFLF